MSFPNSVLLAFEEGHQFHEGYKIIIDAWDQVRGRFEPYEDADGCMHMTAVQAVEAICVSDRFKFVTWDTADMAARMCVDFHSKRAGVEHISDLEWGKGYETLQDGPFRREILRLVKAGRGIGFTTHSKTEIARFSTGEKARKEVTLPKGIMRLLYGQADIIAHGEFGRNRNGIRQRVLCLEGTPDMVAGNRTGMMLPSRYIVDPQKIWPQWKSFFKDPEAAKIAERECIRASRSHKR